MTDDLHNLDGRFKKSAEDFELTPSADVWKNVEREIASPGRRKKIMILLVVGLVLIAGGTAWLLNQTPAPGATADVADQHSLIAVADPPATDSSVLSATNNSNDNRNTGSVTNTEAEIDAPSRPHSSGDLVPPVVSRNKHKDDDALINLHRTTGSIHPEEQGVAEATDPEKAAVATSFDESTVTSLDQPVLHNTEIVTGDNHTVQGNDSVKTVNATDIVNADSLPAILPVVVDDSVWADKLADDAERNRFSITVGFGPAYSFSRYKEKGDYQFLAGYRDSTDKDIAVMNFHLDVGYSWPKTYVYTGIRLLNYKTEIQNRQVVYRYDTGPVTGPVPPPVVVGRDYYHINNNTTGSTINQFTYLGFPVGIREKVLQRNRWSLWLQTELAAYKLIGWKGYVYDYDARVYRSAELRDLRSWQFGFSWSFLFQYEISDRLQLGIAPTGTGFRRPVYWSDYRQSFAQIELRTSLRYSF